MPRPARIARRAGANLARAARRGLAQLALPRRAGIWVSVRLAGALDEIARPRVPFGGEHAASLLEVLETLEAAAHDPRVDGVLLRLAGNPGGWSKSFSLRRAVERVRERGKPVVAYAETLGAEGLLVASAASRLWLPEAGQILLVGLRIEALFLRGLLGHLDVEPEVVRIGSHKTAGDRFTRHHMSPEEREQLEGLLDDLFEGLVGGIAAGRKLAPAAVRDLVDRGPYRARAAVEAGLADACIYPDEIEAQLEELCRASATGPAAPRGMHLVDGILYHSLRASDPGWRPLLAGLPHIAYVVARGAIHRGAGSRGIACDALCGLLERIRRAEEIRGVVLRLESPGGDGMASDLLWRAVSLMRREKPVVVSMGDVVASGGYYMAAAADALLAEAGTVTGSIGVVGGKLNLEGLYRRIGVAKDGIERGARAGLLSETRGFTDEEREVMRAEMAAVYDTFVDRVAQGRGISGEEIERAAQGRVWSGARALELGLVDAIGGPLEALREARRRAGLGPDERVLVDVHPRLRALPSLRPLLRLVPGRIGVGIWMGL
jgi:protease-4